MIAENQTHEAKVANQRKKYVGELHQIEQEGETSVNARQRKFEVKQHKQAKEHQRIENEQKILHEKKLEKDKFKLLKQGVLICT